MGCSGSRDHQHITRAVPNHIPIGACVRVVALEREWPKTYDETLRKRTFEDLSNASGMVRQLANPTLSKGERLGQYIEFVKYQSKIAKRIERWEHDSETMVSFPVVRLGYVTRRYASSSGDIYTVRYSSSARNAITDGSTKVEDTLPPYEDAVGRHRIFFYDFFNIDAHTNQLLASSEYMQQVPEPSEVFDPKYSEYEEKKVSVRNFPFAEDPNAPPLGCCGCGPRRKYIKYTMTRRKGDQAVEERYLYFEGDQQ